MRKIRLSEAQLHRVIKESVKRILKEENAARIMDRINPTNRAKFRTQDMEQDFRNSEPEWMDEPKKGFESLPKEHQQWYRENPDAMKDTLDFYKDSQMYRDEDKYGNPNINPDSSKAWRSAWMRKEINPHTGKIQVPLIQDFYQN